MTNGTARIAAVIAYCDRADDGASRGRIGRVVVPWAAHIRHLLTAPPSIADTSHDTLDTLEETYPLPGGTLIATGERVLRKHDGGKGHRDNLWHDVEDPRSVGGWDRVVLTEADLPVWLIRHGRAQHGAYSTRGGRSATGSESGSGGHRKCLGHRDSCWPLSAALVFHAGGHCPVTDGVDGRHGRRSP